MAKNQWRASRGGSSPVAAMLMVAIMVASGCAQARQGEAAALGKTAAAPSAAPVNAGVVAESLGYYRMPTIHGDTIVFQSEGDLWRVGIGGGRATRLTTHAGDEANPAISPDGTRLAFIATYEGPRELYVMPMEGGLPTRVTYDGVGRSAFVAWADDHTLIHSTGAGASIPRTRLAFHDLMKNKRTIVPLDQASEATIVSGNGSGEAGGTPEIVFTRLFFQGSHTDRYKGGTAQQLWRFTCPKEGEKGAEAVGVTTDFAGTSKRPIFWNGRVYFLTDRDGRMNVWSMTPEGKELKQHTKHVEFDIGTMGMQGGRIVYQLGADLRLLDVNSGEDKALSITLDSDMEQTRERWVKRPATYITSANISANGDRVAITARGRVFVVPAKQGRLVDADTREGIRYRDARFMPDGKTVLALSDESGEVELAMLPTNGVGAVSVLTKDSTVLRWQTSPSPDGALIAHTDKDQRLWLHDVATKQNRLVEENKIDQIDDLSWSPDSKWLAYVSPAGNMYKKVRLHDVAGGTTIDATTDRYDSYSPQWSSDGKWLYFLSDRSFNSTVRSPWGPRQPEPYFDKATKIYALMLKPGERWPFLETDEVYEAEKAAKEKEKDKEPDPAKVEDGEKKGASDAARPAAQPDKPAEKPAEKSDVKADVKPAEKSADSDAKAKKKDAVKVEVVAAGLSERLYEVPVGAGNYNNLMLTGKALLWLSYGADDLEERRDSGGGGATLKSLAIGNEKPEVKTVAEAIRSAQLSLDRKKLLIRKGEAFHIVDAESAKADFEKSAVDLSAWSLSVEPREEWRQMYFEAWRLLRDYFYDRNMHGVDWRGVLEKYKPYVDRVRTRDELADVFAEMTGELSALHHFVRGGDLRRGEDAIAVATLGADLVRDEVAGGYRVVTIYEADSDEPGVRSPLRDAHVDMSEGDVIEQVNGVSTLSVADIAMLLRQKAGRQVLLRVQPTQGGAGAKPVARDVVVKPLNGGEETELRYRSWEVKRRQLVEQWSNGRIGYIHLRAMGTADIGDFARDYYPVFNREGLIMDVRDNGGGNIDSWVLSRLMRKAWMYWNQHAGQAPSWNMQYAFRGHMVALCNERTGSDGEAFSEGFKRLGLGKVIGTRTWGGEIWLSSSNVLVDNGLASAGEFGVFGPEGTWLVEGHGVDPDIIVDNLPHATFLGEDAQLKAAVDHLLEKLAKEPVPAVVVPKTPDKSQKSGK